MRLVVVPEEPVPEEPVPGVLAQEVPVLGAPVWADCLTPGRRLRRHPRHMRQRVGR